MLSGGIPVKMKDLMELGKISAGHKFVDVSNSTTNKPPSSSSSLFSHLAMIELKNCIFIALSKLFDCDTYKIAISNLESIIQSLTPDSPPNSLFDPDCLYFEPLTVEDVLNVINLVQPVGMIVHFGGQTPLKLELPIQGYLGEQKLTCAGRVGHVRILGTLPDSIDVAEDRERFNATRKELAIEQPKGGIAKSETDALSIAADIGYPVLKTWSPSYLLGGRTIEIVYRDEKIVTNLENAVEVDPVRLS